MANQGPNFGLHRTCRMKAKEKFDLPAAVTALKWIESVIGIKLVHRDVQGATPDRGVEGVTSERDVAEVLRDGTALCELMNHIKPGAIKRYHKKPSAFQQMENAELFLKACIEYGMQTIDTFHVKELYEARAMYTVVNCIYALGSLAQQNGYTGPKLGVKLASRNERHFNEEQLQLARRTMSRQHSVSTDAPSQASMTPYGLPRQIMLSGSAASTVASSSHTVIGLQYGSNRVASQSGMTAYGMQRQISTSTGSEYDTSLDVDDANTTTTTSGANMAGSDNPTVNTKICSQQTKSPTDTVIGLQYGSNNVASQSGMTAYGTPRQIVASTSSAGVPVIGLVEENGEEEKGDVFEEDNKT